jgi:hypothetical protein
MPVAPVLQRGNEILRFYLYWTELRGTGMPWLVERLTYMHRTVDARQHSMVRRGVQAWLPRVCGERRSEKWWIADCLFSTCPGSPSQAKRDEAPTLTRLTDAQRQMTRGAVSNG